MNKENIDYKKLLKDIDFDTYSECPEHLVRVGGTEGMICDREGLQYIVADPLVRAIEYLYDLNIRTESSGSNYYNEIGISCDYSSLDERNKQIVDDYLKQKGGDLTIPCAHCSSVRFRISVNVDFDTDTVESAEIKLAEEIKTLGLVKQDVIFGRRSKQEAINQTLDMFSTREMKWNGESFEIVVEPYISEQEALEELLEQGCIIDEDDVWYSEELYRKHLDYLKELKRTGTMPECND